MYFVLHSTKNLPIFVLSMREKQKPRTKQKQKIITNKLKVMKAQSIVLFTQLSKEALQNLTNEVKETLAAGFSGGSRPFKAVDLWNIQRQRRQFMQRRHFA